MPKYHAFISYSQASSRSLATAVERNLKRFAKPWYRVRSLSIFRDETDLSATPRLWSVIKQALDQSAFFILIADPISAKSPWVDRELQYWLETKSPETIIVIVADGLLIWDASSGCFDPLKSDALPPRLMKAFAEEPLFVDMRWARNSTTLSLHDPQFFNQIAELAAPLYGKSKAELATDIGFAPHGSTVLSATRNGRLKLWEAPSGSPLGYDGQHQDSILSIDIASHGLAFASGSADGTARIWNSFTTRLSSEPIVHSSPVSIVKFDAQATHLATGSATAKCLFGTHYRRELFLFGYPGQTRYSWQS